MHKFISTGWTDSVVCQPLDKPFLQTFTISIGSGTSKKNPNSFHLRYYFALPSIYYILWHNTSKSPSFGRGSRDFQHPHRHRRRRDRSRRERVVSYSAPYVTTVLSPSSSHSPTIQVTMYRFLLFSEQACHSKTNHTFKDEYQTCKPL